MAEQTEPAVITPAMLEEEEQLEAAGLEKERKMLEEEWEERACIQSLFSSATSAAEIYAAAQAMLV